MTNSKLTTPKAEFQSTVSRYELGASPSSLPRNEAQCQFTDMHNFASMVIEKRNKMLNADLASQMEYSNN